LKEFVTEFLVLNQSIARTPSLCTRHHQETPFTWYFIWTIFSSASQMTTWGFASKQSLVGSLLYLTVWTSPDLCFAFQQLAKWSLLFSSSDDDLGFFALKQSSSREELTDGFCFQETAAPILALPYSSLLSADDFRRAKPSESSYPWSQSAHTGCDLVSDWHYWTWDFQGLKVNHTLKAMLIFFSLSILTDL
jgi:hypothetical protein